VVSASRGDTCTVVCNTSNGGRLRRDEMRCARNRNSKGKRSNMPRNCSIRLYITTTTTTLAIYIYIYILCSLLVAIPLIIILIIMFPEFVLFYLCPIIKHGCTLHKYIYRHLDLSFKTPRKRDPIMAVPYLMVRTTKLFGICSCLCWGCFTLSHITI
jgi:hypothetical protein